MDGTVLEKARLHFILEHKVRVSIFHLPLFCAVSSMCFKMCFSFCNLLKDFPALCCLIMPLLVNFLSLYFHSIMYSVVFIFLGSIKGAQPKESHFLEQIFFIHA